MRRPLPPQVLLLVPALRASVVLMLSLEGYRRYGGTLGGSITVKLHLGVELHRGCEALDTTVRNKLLLLEGPSPCSPAQALPSDVVLQADLAPYRKHNVRREKATKRLI